MISEFNSSESRWAFVVGSGRTGTTLLSQLLGTSPEVFIAPETKYFQQVWSQRHLLRLLPRHVRNRKIVEHIIAREYPADSPVFGPKRDDLLEAIREASSLTHGFFALLSTLSDRPVLGEKTPWHTFFVREIRSVAPEARFIAMVRDAPATVASLRGRSGFRRVDTLIQCTARWNVFHEEIIRLIRFLEPTQLRVIRFEDLIRNPEAELRGACDFLGVGFESRMLEPAYQDSSFRSVHPREPVGFDTAVLDRWRSALSSEEVHRIRCLTREARRSLGYGVVGDSTPDRPGRLDAIRLAMESRILRAGIGIMRSGFYPFGALTSPLTRRGGEEAGEPKPSGDPEDGRA